MTPFDTARSVSPLPPALERRPTAGVVARDDAIDSILGEAFRADHRPFVLVTGEAGIGKTTVVAEIARQLHADGALVLHGRCLEELRVPYLPISEAIQRIIETAPDSLASRLGANALVEIGRLVRAVHARWPTLPSARTGDADSDRYRLFAAVRDLLEQLGSAQRVILVVEDVHWADTSTALLLRHLATELSPQTVMVLATGRDLDPLGGDAIAPQLRELVATDTIRRVHLEGFDDGAMVDLLEHLAGHSLDSDGVTLARQLRDGTGGNPFFATSILQHLAETGLIAPLAGRWSATVAVEEISLPDSVRDVLGRRLRGIDAELRHVLEVASVLGREFPLDTLARLLDRAEDEVLDLLEAGCETGLVDEDPQRLGWFVFSHALVRQTLYESQSRTRRSKRHRKVAELLEQQPTRDGELAGELAHHWAMDGTESGLRRSCEHALDAGRQALRRLAPSDAIGWFERAASLAARSDLAIAGDVLLDATIGLGEAQRQVGDPSFRTTLIRASLEADLAGDLDRMVRAVLANHRGLVSVVGEVDEERIGLIERAVASLGAGDSPARARLLALLAAESTFSRDHERVRAAAVEAEAVARRLDDDETLLRVLNLVFLSMWVPSELERSLRLTEEAVRLATRVDDPVQAFYATMNRLYVMISALDRPAMDQLLADASLLANEVGQPFIVWRVAFAACVPPLLDGDADRAEALAEAALDIGVQSGQADSFALYGATLTQIRLHQGRIDEMVPLVAELARENPGLPAFTAAHAMMLAETGAWDEARLLVDAALTREFDRTAYDYVWSTATTLWADAASTIGHTEAARVLYEQLRPFPGQGIASGPTMTGTTTHYLARLATTLGLDDEADACFRRADNELADFGATYFLARNKMFWSEAIGRWGGDQTAADVLAQQARAIALEHGCPGIVERIESWA